MYFEEITKLIATLRSYKSKVKLVSAGNFDLDLFPCMKIRGEISEFGYFSSFTLNCNSNGVDFYDLNKILKMRKFFDLDVKEYLVIADASGDPIAIGKDCNLYWSIHGGGEADFNKIATSLEDFFATLTIFATFYFGNFKRNIDNEDHGINWDKYKIIKNAIINNGTEEDVADNFLHCMLYL
ncbi:hypothetical protein [Bartonella sp. HY406]|uniref:hypothetical protein n=1 Tax=Bartonella sp. HY406 TaxID=2979331 RepID=UPI0021C9847C|nr:hypothetical protein [Bartonella sp. HY406]UXN03906.1 hypothetical protein N6B01_02380 [Bartonella sp. HY406]